MASTLFTLMVKVAGTAKSCYKILGPPNRMNGRKGEGKVEGGNTPTLESFDTLEWLKMALFAISQGLSRPGFVGRCRFRWLIGGIVHGVLEPLVLAD